MVSSVLPLRMMSGMGRRRVRRTRSRRVGGRKMKMMIQGSGRRHRVHRTGGARRRIRGYGLFDTLKNIGSKAFNLARSVPIVSTGLNLAGQHKYADVAKSLGFGRRLRAPARRRRHTGGARPKKRTFSVYGGRRMSVYGGRKRRHKRTHRGGLFGSLMGAIPLAMRALGGRRKRRVGGARRAGVAAKKRRTYPSGLLTLRRMLRH